MATQTQTLPQRRARKFYVAVALVATAIVFVGFARTFFLNAQFAQRDLPGFLILHGIVFSLWLVLLVAQTSLVAAERTDLHRRLGVVGGVLALVMIVLGMYVALTSAKHGFQTPGLPPPLIFLVVPLFDIVVFTILIAAAFYYRKKPDVHKRLMIAATISILPPALARFPVAWVANTLPVSAFLLGDVILLGVIACDVFLQRKFHRVWLWSGLLVILSFPLRMWIAGTEAWMAFAQWLTGTS